MISRYGVAWMLMLLLCTPLAASADIIVLTNGNRIEGRVEDPASDPVVVHLGQGFVELFPDMIQEIIPQDFVNDELMNEFDGEYGLEGEGEGEGGVDHVMPELLLMEMPTEPADIAERFDQLAEALSRISLGPGAATSAEIAMRDAFESSIASLGKDGVSAIRKHIDEGSPATGAGMLRALSQIDEASARETASDMLRNHVHPQARMEALSLLAKTGDANAAREALGDDVWYVREQAYQVIASDDGVAATRQLIEGLDDSDEDVRASVTEILSSRAEGVRYESKEDWMEWWSAQPGSESVPAPAPIEKRPSPNEEPWPFD